MRGAAAVRGQHRSDHITCIVRGQKPDAACLLSGIRQDQAQAEILIAWVQLAIVAAFALVYGLTPMATMRAEPHFEPLPWVLGEINYSGEREQHPREAITHVSGDLQ